MAVPGRLSPQVLPEYRQMVCVPETDPGVGENFTFPLGAPASRSAGASAASTETATSMASAASLEAESAPRASLVGDASPPSRCVMFRPPPPPQWRVEVAIIA